MRQYSVFIVMTSIGQKTTIAGKFWHLGGLLYRLPFTYWWGPNLVC